MTMVYVVMGNDFPAAVYENESAAAEHCKRETAKNGKRKADGYSAIYWRAYGFPLNNGSR